MFQRTLGSIHLLGLTGKAFAQFGVLGSHTDRAGIEMTHTHHDAPHSDQGSGGESEFLRAKERGDDDVAAGLQLAIGFDDNA